MLTELFIHILNMSFTASIVIMFVFAARLLLKKAPKLFSYALWSVVLFRLLCPFSFESIISLLPTKAHPISQDIIYARVPKIDTGLAAINNTVNSSLPAATPYASINPLQALLFIAAAVWFAGIMVLLLYSIVSFLKLKKQLGNAIHEKDNVYVAQHLATPFVMGIVNPKIYLPPTLSLNEKQYIVRHEQTHIKRCDHIIKPLSFLALCVHWFNPLVWVAFFACSRDMEMACDEAVIKQLGKDLKKDYSLSLLKLSTGRRLPVGTPLAFGEGDTKVRIKNILNYKKPAFWTAALALVAIVCMSAGLMANPVAIRPSLQWAKNLNTSYINKIELVVMPCKQNEQYRLFEPSEFEAVVSLVNQSRGSYVKTPEPMTGGIISFYITDKNGVRRQVSNNGNRYLIIDGDSYNADYNWLSSWKYTKGNAPLPENFLFENEKPALTLDALRKIVKKDVPLKWEDFSEYRSSDIGSGLYILQYKIDERFYVLIGGPGKEKAPMYIRLCAAGTDKYIDISQKGNDIDKFIESVNGYLPLLYTYQESKDPLKPTITLEKGNKFQFMYSVLSSYIAIGTYELDNNKLILKTDDKKYKYTFKIKGNTLIFDQKESSPIPTFAHLPNKAVFSCSETQPIK
jgi:beta-lactamase regulating signal transducer with metallopeptidase domain